MLGSAIHCVQPKSSTSSDTISTGTENWQDIYHLNIRPRYFGEPKKPQPKAAAPAAADGKSPSPQLLETSSRTLPTEEDDEVWPALARSGVCMHDCTRSSIWGNSTANWKRCRTWRTLFPVRVIGCCLAPRCV